MTDVVMPIPDFLEPLEDMVAPSTSVPMAAARPLGGAAAISDALPNFVMAQQEQRQWCWAAVSSSVAAFYGSSSWTQCLVASGEFSPLDCCGGDSAGGCNKPWYLDAALKRVGHFERLEFSNVSFNDTQQEISGRRPLGCRIAWNGGGAHFVAIGGWSVEYDGTEYVDVLDPILGNSSMKTYVDFIDAYISPGDKWTHSYFTALTMNLALGGSGPIANSPLSA